ncbi:MAG: hypothetical protein Q4D21_07755 [Phascolarctobacterium sp.]|nr:hypothetical protein [Phascolarctobacterium sp.]
MKSKKKFSSRSLTRLVLASLLLGASVVAMPQGAWATSQYGSSSGTATTDPAAAITEDAILNLGTNATLTDGEGLYGGYSTTATTLKDNAVSIYANVTGAGTTGIYGAYTGAENGGITASNNSVIIGDGTNSITVGSADNRINIYGAYFTGTSQADNNSVTVKNGATVYANAIYGASATGANYASGNSVTFEEGSVVNVSGNVYGAHNWRGVGGVNGNTVSIYSDDVNIAGNVYGQYANWTQERNVTKYNTVNMSAGTVGGVYGGTGYTNQYVVLNLYGGTIKNVVMGSQMLTRWIGYSHSNDIYLANTVDVSDAYVQTSNRFAGNANYYNSINIGAYVDSYETDDDGNYVLAADGRRIPILKYVDWTGGDASMKYLSNAWVLNLYDHQYDWTGTVNMTQGQSANLGVSTVHVYGFADGVTDTTTAPSVFNIKANLGEYVFVNSPLGTQAAKELLIHDVHYIDASGNDTKIGDISVGPNASVAINNSKTNVSIRKNTGAGDDTSDNYAVDIGRLAAYNTPTKLYVGVKPIVVAGEYINTGAKTYANQANETNLTLGTADTSTVEDSAWIIAGKYEDRGSDNTGAISGGKLVIGTDGLTQTPVEAPYKDNNGQALTGLFGGYTAFIGHDVSENSLTVNGAYTSHTTEKTNLYGGYTDPTTSGGLNAKVDKNSLTIGSDGSVTTDGYVDLFGAYGGNATNNTLVVDGTVTTGNDTTKGRIRFAGGYGNDASGNSATLNGTLNVVNSGDDLKIWGGYASGANSHTSGSATNNTLTINGTINATGKVLIYGGNSGSGTVRETSNNTIIFGSNANVNASEVNGGYGLYGSNNKVTVQSGANLSVTGSVVGSRGGTSNNNTVTVEDGATFSSTNVYGVYNASEAKNNVVTIASDDATVKGLVIGGHGTDAEYNTVNISGGTYTGQIRAGYGTTASNNTVNISGGNFSTWIIGGYGGNTTNNNVINMSDGTATYLFASYNGTGSGNVINMTGGTVKTELNGSWGGTNTNNTIYLAGDANVATARLAPNGGSANPPITGGTLNIGAYVTDYAKNQDGTYQVDANGKLIPTVAYSDWTGGNATANSILGRVETINLYDSQYDATGTLNLKNRANVSATTVNVNKLDNDGQAKYVFINGVTGPAQTVNISGTVVTAGTNNTVTLDATTTSAKLSDGEVSGKRVDTAGNEVAVDVGELWAYNGQNNMIYAEVKSAVIAGSYTNAKGTTATAPTGYAEGTLTLGSDGGVQTETAGIIAGTYVADGAGNATAGNVVIVGDFADTNTTPTGNNNTLVYGNYAATNGATAAAGNKITVKGTAAAVDAPSTDPNLSAVELVGSYYSIDGSSNNASSANTLVVDGWRGTINSIEKFNAIEFENATADDSVVPALTLTNRPDDYANVNVTLKSVSSQLAVGDKITLLKGADAEVNKFTIGDGVNTDIIENSGLNVSAAKLEDTSNITTETDLTKKEVSATVQGQILAGTYIYEYTDPTDSSKSVETVTGATGNGTLQIGTAPYTTSGAGTVAGTYAATGDAKGGQVLINGGFADAYTTPSYDDTTTVYGNYAATANANAGGAATDGTVSTVTVKGTNAATDPAAATYSLSNVNLIGAGGVADVPAANISSANTLAIDGWSGSVNTIDKFNAINISNIDYTATTPVLNLTGTPATDSTQNSLTGVTVTADIDPSQLTTVGSTVKFVAGNTTAANGVTLTNGATTLGTGLTDGAKLTDSALNTAGNGVDVKVLTVNDKANDVSLAYTDKVLTGNAVDSGTIVDPDGTLTLGGGLNSSDATIVAGSYSATGTANNGKVNITGTFTDTATDKTSTTPTNTVIYGGYSNATTPSSAGNTVTVTGTNATTPAASTADLSKVDLYGSNDTTTTRTADAGNLNTLNIDGWSGTVNSISNFDTINFDNAAAGTTPALNLTKAPTQTGTYDVNLNSVSGNLKMGDEVLLMTTGADKVGTFTINPDLLSSNIFDETTANVMVGNLTNTSNFDDPDVAAANKKVSATVKESILAGTYVEADGTEHTGQGTGADGTLQLTGTLTSSTAKTVAGKYTESGAADGGEVIISTGFNDKYTSGTDGAEGNTTIIYGGYAADTAATSTDNNTVTVKGTTAATGAPTTAPDLKDVTLVGGNVSDDNTLVIDGWTGTINTIDNFNTINFENMAKTADGDPAALAITNNSLDMTNTTVNLNSVAATLGVGDKVVLMDLTGNDNIDNVTLEINVAGDKTVNTTGANVGVTELTQDMSNSQQLAVQVDDALLVGTYIDDGGSWIGNSGNGTLVVGSDPYKEAGASVVAGTYSDAGNATGGQVLITGTFTDTNTTPAGDNTTTIYGNYTNVANATAGGPSASGTVSTVTVKGMNAGDSAIIGNADLRNVNLIGAGASADATDATVLSTNTLAIDGWTGTINSIDKFDNITISNIDYTVAKTNPVVKFNTAPTGMDQITVTADVDIANMPSVGDTYKLVGNTDAAKDVVITQTVNGTTETLGNYGNGSNPTFTTKSYNGTNLDSSTGVDVNSFTIANAANDISLTYADHILTGNYITGNTSDNMMVGTDGTLVLGDATTGTTTSNANIVAGTYRTDGGATGGQVLITGNFVDTYTTGATKGEQGDTTKVYGGYATNGGTVTTDNTVTVKGANAGDDTITADANLTAVDLVGAGNSTSTSVDNKNTLNLNGWTGTVNSIDMFNAINITNVPTASYGTTPTAVLTLNGTPVSGGANDLSDVTVTADIDTTKLTNVGDSVGLISGNFTATKGLTLASDPSKTYTDGQAMTTATVRDDNEAVDANVFTVNNKNNDLSLEYSDKVLTGNNVDTGDVTNKGATDGTEGLLTLGNNITTSTATIVAGAYSATGNANGGQVVITNKGNDFVDTATSTDGNTTVIYGGYVADTTKSSTGNTVTVAGKDAATNTATTNPDLTNVDLVGSNVNPNNTLAIDGWTGTINSISNFKTINFDDTVDSSVASPVININGTPDLSNVDVVLNSTSTTLASGEEVVLLTGDAAKVGSFTISKDLLGNTYGDTGVNVSVEKLTDTSEAGVKISAKVLENTLTGTYIDANGDKHTGATGDGSLQIGSNPYTTSGAGIVAGTYAEAGDADKGNVVITGTFTDLYTTGTAPEKQGETTKIYGGYVADTTKSSTGNTVTVVGKDSPLETAPDDNADLSKVDLVGSNVDPNNTLTLDGWTGTINSITNFKTLNLDNTPVDNSGNPVLTLTADNGALTNTTIYVNNMTPTEDLSQGTEIILVSGNTTPALDIVVDNQAIVTPNETTVNVYEMGNPTNAADKISISIENNILTDTYIDADGVAVTGTGTSDEVGDKVIVLGGDGVTETNANIITGIYDVNNDVTGGEVQITSTFVAPNSPEIYGGYTGKDGGTATENTVTVTGDAPEDLSAIKLFGGNTPEAITDNTLNIDGWTGTIGGVANFDTIVIDNIDYATASETPVVTLGDAPVTGGINDLTNVNIVANIALNELNIGDTVKLLGGTFTTTGGLALADDPEKVYDNGGAIQVTTPGNQAIDVDVFGIVNEPNSLTVTYNDKVLTGNAIDTGDKTPDGTLTLGDEITETPATLVTGAYSHDDNESGGNVLITGAFVAPNAPYIYGGYTDKDGGTATDNIVTVTDTAPEDLSTTNLYGGNSSDDITGNTLNLNGWTGSLGNVANFENVNLNTDKPVTITTLDMPVNGGGTLTVGNKAEDGTITGGSLTINELNNGQNQNYNFYVPNTYAMNSGDSFLTIGGDADISNSKVTMTVAELNVVQNDDMVTLITADNLTANNMTNIVNLEGDFLDYTFEMSQEGNSYVAHAKVSPKEDAKSPVETMLAATAMINQGSDMLSANGFDAMSEAAKEDGEKVGNEQDIPAKAERDTHIFALAGASKMRHSHSSHIDTKGWNAILGLGRMEENKSGSLTYGPIFEYGKGDYDSYLNNGVHGEGDTEYAGGGFMAKQVNNSGVYYEGSFRVGRSEVDYVGTFTNGKRVSYDSDSTYIAAHLGMGYVTKVSDSRSLEYYGKLFYTHLQGDDVKLSNGSEYKFDDINSTRMRLGMRMHKQLTNRGKLYYGLAYQYEFSGDADAVVNGVGIKDASLQGSSGIGEIGYVVASKNHYELDLNGFGSVGKQRGVGAKVQYKWFF